MPLFYSSGSQDHFRSFRYIDKVDDVNILRVCKFHSAKVLYRVSPDPIFLGAGGARLAAKLN